LTISRSTSGRLLKAAVEDGAEFQGYNKAESPEMKIFVTFQWEDLNKLWYRLKKEISHPG